jgi:hypothetical protein
VINIFFPSNSPKDLQSASGIEQTEAALKNSGDILDSQAAPCAKVRPEIMIAFNKTTSLL